VHKSQALKTIRRGLVAGIAGTLVLSVFDRLERRLLGREPLYAPSRIAARLAARFGIELSATAARRAGWALRAVYGPSLGVAGAWLDPGTGRRTSRACRHGLAISVFELTVSPLVGAAPPLARWPLSEVFLLVAHATAFAAGAELASPE